MTLAGHGIYAHTDKKVFREYSLPLVVRRAVK